MAGRPRCSGLVLIVACTSSPIEGAPEMPRTDVVKVEVPAKVEEAAVKLKAPAGPAPVVMAPPSAQLEVEARLVESDRASRCGRAHRVVVMRYEVVRVIAGSYPGSELYVAHTCLEMRPDRCEGHTGGWLARFEVGAVHRLQLKRGAGGGALVDKFTASGLPRYRLRCGSVVAVTGP